MPRRAILIALLLPVAAARGEDAAANAEKKNSQPAILNVGGVENKAGGTISGIVKFTGEKPQLPPLVLQGNAFCQKCHPKDPPPDELCVLGTNGADTVLQNVLVYVSKGLEGKQFDPPKTPAVLDQVGCIYKPRVLAVMVYQTVEVRNSDETLHNVMANPLNNRPFNTGMPGLGVISKVFKDAELKIKFQCFMHKWMIAYVHVLEHPFFAITQADGTFTLKGLPPGEYEVSVVHEWSNLQPDAAALPVKVGAGEHKKLDFVYQLKK